MISRLALVIMIVAAACQRADPPASSRHVAPPPVCPARARLTELAQFYRAVATEQTTFAEPELVAFATHLHSLVVVEGSPSDTRNDDVLALRPGWATLITTDGEDHPLDEVELRSAIMRAGKSSSLLLEISPDTPSREVARALRDLAIPPPPYAYTTIAIAYQVDGVFAHRSVPKIQGLVPGEIDIPSAGVTIAKDAEAHCPALAAYLDRLRDSAGPDLLRDAAPLLASCDCTVDVAPLEALPWLVRTRLFTAVPLVASAPALPDDDTPWQELVRRNGGKPLAVALPPFVPVPPMPR